MRVIVIEPNNLNIIGDLDQYSYLLWETHYQSPGKFQISCAKGARGSDLLQVGNIVMAIDELRARVGIIGYEDLTLDEEGNERWNKQGYDLNGLLAYRVAMNKILDGATGGYDEQTNNAESLMHYYVNVEAINPTDTSRKIPFLTLGSNLNRGDTLTYRARLQTLEEIIREISLVSGLGYQIRLDLENKLFIFEALQGEDKSSVVKLSPNLGNVKSIEYMYDEMTSRNVAIVGGEGEGASRYFVVSGDKNYTFTRDSIAYTTDGKRVEINEPRFETGKFGKAFLIEEGTTNLIQNGGFETGDFTGWTTWGSGGTKSIVSTGFYGKCAYLKLPASANANFGIQSVKAPFAANDKIAIQFKVKGDIPNYLHIMTTAGNYSISSLCTYTPLINDWKLATYTWTVPSSRDVGILLAYDSRTGNNYEGYFDDVQVEKKQLPTSFIDGVRANEILDVPTPQLNNWTMEAWAKTNQESGSHRMPFSAWDKFYVSLVPDNRACISWVDGTQKFAYSTNPISNPTDWHYWALTFDGNRARLYIDGVSVVEAETYLPRPFPSNIRLGSLRLDSLTNRYFWNGLIENFRITNRVRTPSEILEIYQKDSLFEQDKGTVFLLPANTLSRREVFVSANDLPDNQLIQKGKETLEEMAEKMTLSCEFIPHGPFEIGTDFNLGDFIQVSYPNVAEAIVRVAGIVEEWSREGKRMSLVLGKESQDIKMLLRYYKKLFYATSRR